jgi:sugar lactone lactonase YvrE
LHPIALHSRRRIWIRIILIAFFPALIGCSHAHSQTVSSAVKPPPIEFVQQWGMRGTEPGQLENPIGPVLDTIGRVYFADRATSFIQKFEAGGIPLLCFQTPAARTADAIAVDSGGAIYVANSRLGAMQLFFPQGDPLRALRFAPRRNYDGPFFFSIDADGRIYVPDPAGSRVQVLNSHGQLLKIWRILPDASEKAARPFAAVANNGAVYIGDATGGRILKFGPDGVQSGQFEPPESADVSRLLGLAAAGKHVFALRGSPPRLEVWSEDGRREFVDALGNRLSGVESAAYLAADPAGDLIVLDPEARRVLRFRTHLDVP